MAGIARNRGEPSQIETVYPFCVSVTGWHFNIELNIERRPASAEMQQPRINK